MITATRLPYAAHINYRGGTRRPIDVLLLDAHYRQVLTCMRVFAQAGLAVGAATGISDSRWAPSFRSRRCAARATLPDLADGESYVDGVLAILDAMPVAMVLPAHDGSIESLRRRRAEFEGRCALPLASDAALAIATSKDRTLALAAKLGIAIPDSVAVSDEADLRDALKSIGLPAVMKPAQSWNLDPDGVGTRLFCELVQTEDEAFKELHTMVSAGGSALIQPWLPGSREAVTLFRAQGRFWARFAQVSHREWPPLGGTSVLCESIPLYPDIVESAERLVDAMDLDGCAMVEFRRDREGRPVLMEVNPRMGATVGLAVLAGVNIPDLVYRWGMGLPLNSVDGYRVGQRLRSIAGEMWYLHHAFARNSHPDIMQPGKAMRTVISDFVVHPSRLDGISLRDPRPGFTEIQEAVQRHAWPRIRGWVGN
jgi:predicted ATP-grasp superfamily ATP-dependent carboligase